MEEAGGTHLDADARLPPRKRLLAGLKKQNSDASSPSSSPAHSVSTDITRRLRHLLTTDSNGSSLSTHQIVEASRSAARAAAQVAAAAKARAQDKATVAAKAVTAAKTALELVASMRSQRERASNKDKPKKHLPVKLLYKKRKRGHKGETDEQVARKLHQVINSSPRILKNSTGSDQKVDSNSKRRKRLVFEKTLLSDGTLPPDATQSSVNDINSEAGTSVQRDAIVELDDKISKSSKAGNSGIISLLANGEAETNHSAGQVLEDAVSTGRKRGRIKQKKLSLTLCTVRDRQNTKEEPKCRRPKPAKESNDNSSIAVNPELTVESSSGPEVLHEAVSAWKPKEFSAPQCYSGSNILGSLCSNPTVTTGSAMVEVDK